MEDLRLLILDIDGTLYRRYAEAITPPVLEAIQNAQQRGIKVAIATGRMYRSALRFHQAIAADVPIIAYNGAWLQDPLADKPERCLSIPIHLGLEVLEYLMGKMWRSHLHLHVYHHDQLYVSHYDERTASYEQRTGCTANVVQDLREIVALSPTKILAVCKDQTIPQKLLAATKDHYTNDQLYCTQSTEFYVEFTSPQATKGNAVKYLTEKILHLASENVMAIGDNFNDQEMLQYVGLGVAMGNAPPEVQAIANYVTDTVHNDGVAQAIQKFCL